MPFDFVVLMAEVREVGAKDMVMTEESGHRMEGTGHDRWSLDL